jgi:hypothetical protein
VLALRTIVRVTALTSSIDEEQKESDSRMNSLRKLSLVNLVIDIQYVTAPTQLTSAMEVASPTQITSPTQETTSSRSTTSTSILDVNNGARSGGYSPGGAVILGARSRADSKSSKTSKV